MTVNLQRLTIKFLDFLGDKSIMALILKLDKMFERRTEIKFLDVIRVRKFSWRVSYSSGTQKISENVT